MNTKRPELLKDKPLSQEEKTRLIAIAGALAKEWMTKPEIMEMFNLPERKTRDCISAIAKRLPVISVSDRAGYKLATRKSDLDIVKQAKSELDSRIKELTVRRNKLDEFIKHYEQEEN